MASVQGTRASEGNSHLGILLKCQHDFGCAIPASSNVFGHETSFGSRGFCRFDRPSEAEITDLEITIGIEQQIGGFEVSVYNISRMQRLEGAQGLVDEVLGVIIR